MNTFWKAVSGPSFSKDLLASIVVFLVALPLCMGIAIASGVPVGAGLVTGIVAGIVVGSLAGCPLQVSGPAAGLTVVVYETVQRNGLEMLGITVLIAGLLQVVAGLLRFGQWFRAVSPAVVTGMLAGIGVLIFASQFHVMLDDKPKGGGVANLAAIPETLQKALRMPEIQPQDIRHGRREMAIKLGELHRREVMVQERIGERIPHHHGPPIMKPGVILSDLVEGQQQTLNELRQILDASGPLFETQPERMKQVQELGAAAIAAIETSRDDFAADRGSHAMEAHDNSVKALASLQTPYKNHELAALIGIMTIILLASWKLLSKTRLGVIPGPLIAVVAATLVAWFADLPILYVEAPASIADEIHFPSWGVLSDAPWGGVISAAIFMAVIASAETLLSATAVDRMHNGPRAKYDKELFSQGIGNIICGMLGALPMTGVIVRSSANVHAGAKTRRSAILHGVWLLVFVVALGFLLKLIPTSALAAILVYTGYKLVDWKSIKYLAQFGWSEVGIYAVTVMVIVIEDLLVGVLVGIALAIIKLVFKFTYLKVWIDQSAGSQQVVVRLEGLACFLRLPMLARSLDRVPAKTHVEFDLTQLSYIDHACLELLKSWAEQHAASGGKVVADWDALKDFARDGRRPQGVRDSISRVA